MTDESPAADHPLKKGGTDTALFPENRIRLVALRELYAYYDVEDHAFEHVMTDPDARIISPSEVVRHWPEPRCNAEELYAGRGLWPLHVAALHFDRLGLPFEYLDIGANVGLTTFMTAMLFQRLGWSVPVVGFEPHPQVFDLLRRGVSANGFDGLVEVFERACSDTAVFVDFYMTPAQTPASSLLPEAVNREFVVWNQATRVQTVRLDHFLSGRGDRSLVLKIDAEGADFKVLDGLGDQLRSRFCIGQIEFFPMILDAYARPHDYLTCLSEDFELYDLQDGEHTISAILGNSSDIKTYVDSVRARRPFGAGDILLVPKRLPELESFQSRLLAR